MENLKLEGTIALEGILTSSDINQSKEFRNELIARIRTHVAAPFLVLVGGREIGVQFVGVEDDYKTINNKQQTQGWDPSPVSPLVPGGHSERAAGLLAGASF